jgi:putative membrane protein
LNGLSLGDWNFEPNIWVPLAVTGLVYAWGTARAWRTAGFGRGMRVYQALAFSGALAVLTIALLSPLERLSDERFSAHMLQHTLLVLAAAPLLAAGAFPAALFWALPRRWAHRASGWLGRSPALRRIGAVLFHPVCAWALFALALWTWHIPAFYQAALENDAVHALEHACFLLSASLFWWVLLRPVQSRAVRYGMALPYLFTTGMHMSLLGALFTLASHPLYGIYAAALAGRGMDALQDQQTAGLIMWVPGGVLFTLLSAVFFMAWFAALEERAAQRDTEAFDPHPGSTPLRAPEAGLPSRGREVKNTGQLLASQVTPKSAQNPRIYLSFPFREGGWRVRSIKDK